MVGDLLLGAAAGVLVGVPLGAMLGAGAAVYATWRVFNQGNNRRITIEHVRTTDAVAGLGSSDGAGGGEDQRRAGEEVPS